MHRFFASNPLISLVTHVPGISGLINKDMEADHSVWTMLLPWKLDRCGQKLHLKWEREGGSILPVPWYSAIMVKTHEKHGKPVL